jgi:hypothetical protein
MTDAISRRIGDRDAAGLGPGGARGLGGPLLIVSGVVAAFGVVFLALMFAAFATGARDAGLAFGQTNDVLVLVGYLLAMPAVPAVGAMVRPGLGGGRDGLVLIGLTGLAAVVALQLLLVAGTLTFEEQVGPVSIAMLVLGLWFVAVGWLGSARGVLPRGRRMGVLAALYVGYPIWAIWLGRRLVTAARSGVQNRSDAV